MAAFSILNSFEVMFYFLESPFRIKHVVLLYLGVSQNRGTPKWMVKIMENPVKMDDFGVPLFYGNTQKQIYTLW